ncbi:MAG: hypothetical protein EOP48_00590 [Sphingobacteriales bacterium]|nr:MAG: hypothetical protein EOP48_00590 [Sphingobacteriales bacterium]
MIKEFNCLIIDNEDQTSSFEMISKLARDKGLKVNCYQLIVGGSERPDLLTEGKINLEKVFQALFNEHKRHYDLIAFDWDLEDPEVNGVELIRHFTARKFRKNVPKMLYSGILKDRIRDRFELYKQGDITLKSAYNEVHTLITVGVVDFADRTKYEEQIINFLSKVEETTDRIIQLKLREYPNYVFRGVFPPFEGKTLGEIAEHIDKDVDIGNKFVREFLDQAVASFIDLD